MKNVETGCSKKHRVQDAAALANAQKQLLVERQWVADGGALDELLGDVFGDEREWEEDGVLRAIAYAMPGDGEASVDKDGHNRWQGEPVSKEQDDSGVLDWVGRELQEYEEGDCFSDSGSEEDINEQQNEEDDEGSD